MNRQEILRKKADIDRVFSSGKRFNAFPLVMMVLAAPAGEDAMIKVLFSVPKRRFKKAVDRNRIKRQLKEAFRLNKTLLPPSAGLHLALVFTGTVLPEYKELEAKIIVLLSRLTVSDEETPV